MSREPPERSSLVHAMNIRHPTTLALIPAIVNFRNTNHTIINIYIYVSLSFLYIYICATLGIKAFHTRHGVSMRRQASRAKAAEPVEMRMAAPGQVRFLQGSGFRV